MIRFKPMLHPILLCSALALAPPALAQEEAADDRALREELQAARAELAEAARRMARLQRELVEQEGRRSWVGRASEDGDIEQIIVDGPFTVETATEFAFAGDTPRLGVLIDGGRDGYEILGVTPGGGAEAAGLERGDRIIEVNGRDVDDGDTSLREALAEIEPGTVVPVAVERDGERFEFEVETSTPAEDISVFARRFAREEGLAHMEALRKGLEGAQREIILMHDGEAPVPPLRPRLPGLFVLGGDSDLVGNHEGLAPYFGTGDGVIVLRIDEDNPLTLADGDVVLSIDGEPVRRPVDLGRAMLDREPGDRVVLEVMRNGALTQIEGRVPDSLMPRIHGPDGLGLRFPAPPRAPEAPAAPSRM